MLYTYYVGWLVDDIYVCCKEIYGLTEAREFAREVSKRYGLAQLEGDNITTEPEVYKNGVLC